MARWSITHTWGVHTHLMVELLSSFGGTNCWRMPSGRRSLRWAGKGWKSPAGAVGTYALERKCPARVAGHRNRFGGTRNSSRQSTSIPGTFCCRSAPPTLRCASRLDTGTQSCGPPPQRSGRISVATQGTPDAKDGGRCLAFQGGKHAALGSVFSRCIPSLHNGAWVSASC